MLQSGTIDSAWRSRQRLNLIASSCKSIYSYLTGPRKGTHSASWRLWVWLVGGEWQLGLDGHDGRGGRFLRMTLWCISETRRLRRARCTDARDTRDDEPAYTRETRSCPPCRRPAIGTNTSTRTDAAAVGDAARRRAEAGPCQPLPSRHRRHARAGYPARGRLPRRSQSGRRRLHRRRRVLRHLRLPDRPVSCSGSSSRPVARISRPSMSAGCAACCRPQRWPSGSRCS